MSTTNPDRAAEIQRYELVSHGSYNMRYESMDEDPDGDWVKYDDHARMTTDLRQLLGQAPASPSRPNPRRRPAQSGNGPRRDGDQVRLPASRVLRS